MFDLYFKRGCTKFTLKDYLGAKSDFSKAVAIDGEIGAVFYNRGMANLELGLIDQACVDWSKAGELGFAEAYDSIKEYCNK